MKSIESREKFALVPEGVAEKLDAGISEINPADERAQTELLRISVIDGIGDYAAFLQSLGVEGTSIAKEVARMLSSNTQKDDGTLTPKKIPLWLEAVRTIGIAKQHLAENGVDFGSSMRPGESVCLNSETP